MSSRRSSLLKTLSKRLSLTSAEEKKEDDDAELGFLSSPLGPQVATLLEQYAEKIHDDSFLKIIRQLEFWYSRLSDDDFLALAERLAKIAS